MKFFTRSDFVFNAKTKSFDVGSCGFLIDMLEPQKLNPLMCVVKQCKLVQAPFVLVYV